MISSAIDSSIQAILDKQVLVLSYISEKYEPTTTSQSNKKDKPKIVPTLKLNSLKNS